MEQEQRLTEQQEALHQVLTALAKLANAETTSREATNLYIDHPLAVSGGTDTDRAIAEAFGKLVGLYSALWTKQGR